MGKIRDVWRWVGVELIVVVCMLEFVYFGMRKLCKGEKWLLGLFIISGEWIR